MDLSSPSMTTCVLQAILRSLLYSVQDASRGTTEFYIRLYPLNDKIMYIAKIKFTNFKSFKESLLSAMINST